MSKHGRRNGMVRMNGEEEDAFKARHLLGWRRGVVKRIKRACNKRERRNKTWRQEEES